MNVMNEIISHGFPQERGRLIHALVGGSQLHGVKLEGTDDHDIYGIYVEAPECCFWEAFPHFVTSTAPQSERNKAGDVDVICYSLRKFARLAAAGNPTILHMLFTPADMAGSLHPEACSCPKVMRLNTKAMPTLNCGG